MDEVCIDIAFVCTRLECSAMHAGGRSTFLLVYFVSKLSQLGCAFVVGLVSASSVHHHLRTSLCGSFINPVGVFYPCKTREMKNANK